MSTRREALRGFLCRTPFFGGLEEAALDRVIGGLTERTLEAGEEVYRQGDQGHSMFVVETGRLVSVCAGEHGREVRIARLLPGDFFGDTTLIAMQPRPNTVRAEEPSRLLELTNMELYKLYKQDVRAYVMVLQNMNRELCRRLSRSESRITQLADESGDEKTQLGPTPR